MAEIARQPTYKPGLVGVWAEDLDAMEQALHAAREALRHFDGRVAWNYDQQLVREALQVIDKTLGDER